MRVVAGRLSGRTIRTPATDAVRPTYDRVRESVFAIVEPELEDAVVLDLFAGSGSLGIESLSRGARSATFVEKDPGVLRVTRENVESLGLTEQCRLVRGDAMVLLTSAVPGGPFDVVFVDPPYESGLAAEALESLSLSGHLSEGAVVVVEHSAGDELDDTVGRLTRIRSKRYGSTTVDFYETRATVTGREEQT